MEKDILEQLVAFVFQLKQARTSINLDLVLFFGFFSSRIQQQKEPQQPGQGEQVEGKAPGCFQDGREGGTRTVGSSGVGASV